MGLVSYAKDELRIAGYDSEDSDYGGMISEAVVELMEVFSKQGHSGASAPVVINLFTKLAKFEPITPLTGEDDEWNKVGENIYQNRRSPSVFKQNGVAYDLDGKVFCEPNGCCYTSSNSRVNITFPYVPHTEYVKVDENGNIIEESVYKEG